MLFYTTTNHIVIWRIEGYAVLMKYHIESTVEINSACKDMPFNPHWYVNTLLLLKICESYTTFLAKWEIVRLKHTSLHHFMWSTDPPTTMKPCGHLSIFWNNYDIFRLLVPFNSDRISWNEEKLIITVSNSPLFNFKWKQFCPKQTELCHRDYQKENLPT